MVSKPYFLRDFKTLFFHMKTEGRGQKPYEKIGFPGPPQGRLPLLKLPQVSCGRPLAGPYRALKGCSELKRLFFHMVSGRGPSFSYEKIGF